MSDSVNNPVGTMSDYSKEPFKDNVNRSMPPMTEGATSKHEGDTHHAAGGKPYGKTFSGATDYLEKTSPTKPPAANGSSQRKMWGC